VRTAATDVDAGTDAEEAETNAAFDVEAEAAAETGTGIETEADVSELVELDIFLVTCFFLFFFERNFLFSFFKLLF
jgi:hypothetical protein